MNMLFHNLFRYHDFGLLFYRIVFGLSMMAHGYFKFAGGEQKLYAIGHTTAQFGVPDGFLLLGMAAAGAELLGGFLLILGFLTRLGALLIAFTLFIATAAAWDAGFFRCDYPSQMMFGAIMLFIAGPGRYSVDSAFTKR